MITYPSEVLDFLYHLQLEQHKPAWMLVSADGEIIDRGGHLDHYKFSQSGTQVDEVCPWLFGLLPHKGDRLELSFVEVDDNTAFQPYLMPYGLDDTLVIVLDMSAELVLQRAAQQAINEGSLVRQSRASVLPDFFDALPAELGFLLLEKRANGVYVIFGQAPLWWELQRQSCTVADLVDVFPMVENFLDDADEVWAGIRESAVSEVWEMHDGLALFASAHQVKDHKLLLIRSPGPVYDELRKIVEQSHSD